MSSHSYANNQGNPPQSRPESCLPSNFGSFQLLVNTSNHRWWSNQNSGASLEYAGTCGSLPPSFALTNIQGESGHLVSILNVLPSFNHESHQYWMKKSANKGRGSVRRALSRTTWNDLIWKKTVSFLPKRMLFKFVFLSNQLYLTNTTRSHMPEHLRF